MLASVIVPAHDAAATLPRTLGGVAAQELDGEFETIVVDDGSTDTTARVGEEHGALVIRESRPGGPGAARNRGAAAAQGGVLAFVDADCVPTAGWLAAGVRALGGAGLVQGRVEPPPGAAVGPFDRTLWVTRPWGLFESANLFVRRDVFDALGGFGDGLLPIAGAHFGEDVVFGWNARRRGIPTAFCDEALVHHEVFPRTAVEFISERRRAALFAALVREVPELRETFLHRRVFLSRRSAAFALAAVGAVAAGAARRPELAALAAAPYAGLAAVDLRDRGPGVALAHAAADAVGFASAVRGSVAFRRLVL